MSNIDPTEELLSKLIDSGRLDEVVERVLQKRKKDAKRDAPLDAWFLGPKAEQGDLWLDTFDHIFRDYVHWRRNYFPQDPIVVDRDRLSTHDAWVESLKFEIDNVLNLLKAHFPIYSPRYNAHMVSEQTFPGVVGYFAAMLYNPNNVTEEAAPITAELEIEVGKMVASMLGYNPKTAWAHLCSGGTLANLEALWVARSVQTVPLVVQDYCRVSGVKDFTTVTPDGKTAHILDLSPSELLGLRPGIAMTLPRKLAAHLFPARGGSVIKEINDFVRHSRFSVAGSGVAAVFHQIAMRPVLFVSEAAHYSIRKTANLLGYGENRVRPIPVDQHFRMRADALDDALLSMADDEYTAAVIGIVGTTEEGAVDPVHEIKFMRDRLESESNRSFWLHVDAAWGGYIRSVFTGLDLPQGSRHKPLNAICAEYSERMNIREDSSLDLVRRDGGHTTREVRRLHLEWNDPTVYSAFLAVPDADSVTVDPHKMGYIPYPAGIIVFQRRSVTDLIAARAQYITDDRGGIRDLEREPEIKEVGPYIIEGSKPGAAAAACWLSHKTIPLTINGHGKIIKTSLLNAKRFARYISLHSRMFDTLQELLGMGGPAKQRFEFQLLSEPDTNVVCFLCVPVAEKDGKSVRDPRFSLEQINHLNKSIYLRSTIKNEPRKRRTPYAQEYFVSRTTLNRDQYSLASVEKLLERFDFPVEDYDRHGIFVLRSTVMNPWHHLAEQQGKNYLLGFLTNLHKSASEILSSMEAARNG
jgi:glutamate/tyrosine decarboxylase-like PLP-dependent enzyme